MRTLSATLEAAQKSLAYDPIWKVVLSRTSQTTRGYDRTRVIGVTHPELNSSSTGEITLHNADGDLTSLDFEHYEAVLSYGMATGASRSAWATGTAYSLDDIRIPTSGNVNGFQYRCAVAGTSHATTEPTWPTDLGVRVVDEGVTWEMDGNDGDEYSRAAPLRVRVQELHSGRGILRVILRCEGIFNQMAEDNAGPDYTQDADDTNTVKTLITAIVDATLDTYTGYTSFNATYDSEDNIIDTFVPKDYFKVPLNANRLSKVEELLAYTGVKKRAEADGKVHFLDPVTTGATYAYEYKFNVSGDHTFWNKTIRLRFVNPNKEIVKSHPDHTPQYRGTAVSSTSNALASKTHTTERRLPSNAQAILIAAAIIEGYELDDEKGFATVPMNVGQELWDFVKITDSRQGDTRTGNIQYLQRNIKIPVGSEPMVFNMTLSFGKLSPASILANALTASRGDFTNTQLLFAMVQELNERIWDLDDRVSLNDSNIRVLDQREIIPKLHVTKQLIIPVEL